MSDIFTVEVGDVTEHEDGSATYSFNVDKDGTEVLSSLGLQFLLYCAAYGWDIGEALNSLMKED